MLRVLLDVIGKVWNLPNTLLGLAYGVVGHLAGWLRGLRPRISLGNNAIQFHDSGLMLTAMALGLRLAEHIHGDASGYLAEARAVPA